MNRPGSVVDARSMPYWIKTSTVVALCVACAGVMTAVGQQPVGPQNVPGVRRALLIGIDDYKAVPGLMGAENDVKALRAVLLTRWGFPEGSISTLLNAAATREGILRALNTIVQQSNPNDVVYVHYSGHGSQVRDRNGDEPDGLDETLVPHDGRTKGVRDITDDELDAIFARFRTRSVVLVLDSCHSGTATRAVDIRTRAIPADERTALYEMDAPTTRAIVPVISSRYLLLSAAASHQEALDGPVNGRYHGFFSYALVRSANSLPSNANARQIFGGIAQELGRIQQRYGRVAMPEPQLEGPPALFDRPLFNAPAPARVSWLNVTPLPPARVILGNGAALGAVPGTRWAIHPPGDLRFVPGQALAVAVVGQQMGDDALATLLPGSRAIPPGARAVQIMAAPASGQFAVRLGNVPPALRLQLQTALSRDVVNVSLVAEDQPARYIVDVADDRVRLSTSDGLKVLREFPMGSPSTVDALTSEFVRSAAADELLALDNPSAALRVTATVANRPTVATRGVSVVADTSAAAYRVRRAGEPRSPSNSLQLEVSVSTAAYLTIIGVDSQGGVNLLFPNTVMRRQFLPDGGQIAANTTLRVPDSLDAGNQAGFFWDYSPPIGTDTIRVFASTDLLVAKALRERALSLQGIRGRALATGLAQLREQLSGLAVRGINVVADESGSAADWAAATVTITVSE